MAHKTGSILGWIVVLLLVFGPVPMKGIAEIGTAYWISAVWLFFLWFAADSVWEKIQSRIGFKAQTSQKLFSALFFSSLTWTIAFGWGLYPEKLGELVVGTILIFVGWLLFQGEKNS